MSNFSQFPPKNTPEIESELCRVLFDNPKSSEEAREKARETLILGNMQEALAYATSFARRNPRMDAGDIISRTYMALRSAARNFKPHQIRFFAYAKPYVRGAIFSHHKESAVVPRLERFLPAATWETQKTEEPTTDAHTSDFEDILFGTSELDLDAVSWKLLWEEIEPLLSRLTKKEQEVIRDFRAGLNFPEMGAKRGVSRAAMQSTFARAIGKLKGYVHGRT